MKEYNGFYKVAEDGGGVCVGTFYNPITKESFTKITWDIDDIRLEGDEYIQTLRFLPLDKEVRKQWLHENGVIQEGDTVEVIKGRKYPKGMQGIITKVYDYKDKYNRYVATYCITDNGMKINCDNVKMVV